MISFRQCVYFDFGLWRIIAKTIGWRIYRRITLFSIVADRAKNEPRSTIPRMVLGAAH